MSFYVLANDIISVLSKTKIPSYHQFGEELIARRNDCFITVGITGLNADESVSEAEAEISFYAPSNFSGGKILSLASKIPETIMSSDLSVKSIKASDLFYEKKLDRLCYNFSLKLTYTVGNITDKISIGETVISVSSFSPNVITLRTSSRVILLCAIKRQTESTLSGVGSIRMPSGLTLNIQIPP